MGIPKFIKPLEEEFAVCPSSHENYVNDWVKTGWVGFLNLDLVLSEAVEKKASDIHIVAYQKISFTILGDIVFQDYEIPDEDTMTDLVVGILSNQAMGDYVKDLEYDTSYTIRFGRYSGRRLRVNIGKSFNNDMLTFRIINDEIPKLSDLGLTQEMFDLFRTSSGVILFSGATGSGKSTSLASVLREIQLTEQKKIITIEKPIEYVYPKDGKALIIQRNIPSDCNSFSDGLTSAMRSAPNIILIGEVRNKEEVDELLRASETGHLTLSTIHASNNIVSLNRIRSLFAGDEQRRILSTLGDNLIAIISQTLVKTKDGKQRKAIREILKVDPEIRKLIINDEFLKIRALQENSKSTMEHHLLEEYLSGNITLKTAQEKSPDRVYFDSLLELS